jgi:hypothetical protein
MDEVPDIQEPGLPRWAQILAGVVLLPITALSVVGAVSIFGIPKVQAEPMLQPFAGLIVFLCLWAAVLAIRMLFGIQGKYGLFGPVALRIIAIVAVGLVIGGAFTGVYVEHPVRSTVLALSYAAIAIRLWQLAAQRAAAPPNKSLERTRAR